MKCRTRTQLGFDPARCLSPRKPSWAQDSSAVALNNFLADGQADPCASDFLSVQPFKRSKDQVQVLCRNPDSVVSHGEFRFALGNRPSGDFDSRLFDWQLLMG